MPCNDHQHIGDEGITLDASSHDAAIPSSSINANNTTEERRANMSVSSVENNASHNNSQPSSYSEQRSTGRSRAASTRSVNLNFMALPGEELVLNPDNENCVDMDSCRLFLTRYRIIVASNNQNALCAIPLTGVDLLEAKEIVGLQISCKDGRIIKLQAANSEIACTWYKKLIQKTCIARDLSSIFAFKFYNETSKSPQNWLLREERRLSSHDQLEHEFKRLKLNKSNWKITDVNKTFDVCATYPEYLIVPSTVDDEELKQMSFGRYYRRFPTVVWQNHRKGTVLLRSSQPSIGFFGIVNDKDVTLFERIRGAISPDPNLKFLILDARSYAAAWANRAKGGGFEAADTYKNAEVVFMGLPNIHNIRYSFHQLRQLLNNSATDPAYLQTLQSTLWLQNIAQLFAATERCLNSLCFEGVSVLVHCSDGWDRTTQIVSLCMLIADSYYRTFDGFEMLIQRQWVEFGHKFADRGGVLNSDDNEKSPVFLQFLDCVYQLWMNNQDQFEFNRRYLMKLVQHTFSGLFGTFLFNSVKEAIKKGCDPNGAKGEQKAYQVWSYLGKHNADFHNPAYGGGKATMLRYPKTVPELSLWRDAYCCTVEQSIINNPENLLHHQSNGLGNIENSCEKSTNPLSRSQSAASLTSLNGTSVQSNNHCFMTSNGTINGTTGPACHLATKFNDNCSLDSASNFTKLDEDGLSPYPPQLEDFVLKKQQNLEKEMEKQRQQKFNSLSGPQNIQTRDGHTNGKMVNGIEGRTTNRKRNESDDFEFVGGNSYDYRLKHPSSASLTSGCQPSSFSSTISDCNNAICTTKNWPLQEGIENGGENGTTNDNGAVDGLEMVQSRASAGTTV